MQEERVSIVRACRILQLDRSLFYYRSVKDDSEVETKLTSYLENKVLCNRGCPEYYKRMRREGLPWNHKRVERVYRKMRLSKRRKRKRRIPNPEKRPLIQPALMNETWSMDFVEDRLENGRRIRTLNIIDDFNREALAMEVSYSFPAERVVKVIEECIEWRGKPKRIRSDNGTEFIAIKTKQFFSSKDIEHIPIQKSKPAQNGYIDGSIVAIGRVFSTLSFSVPLTRPGKKRLPGWKIITTTIHMKVLEISLRWNMAKKDFSNQRETD